MTKYLLNDSYYTACFIREKKKNIGAKLQLAETVAKTALFNNVASSRY